MDVTITNVYLSTEIEPWYLAPGYMPFKTWVEGQICAPLSPLLVSPSWGTFLRVVLSLLSSDNSVQKDKSSTK